jgi:hypothetical protein
MKTKDNALLLALTMLGAAALGEVPDVLAQPFAEAMRGLVDYPKAQIAPRKSCETLEHYKSEEIVQIHAGTVPAEGQTPSYCKLTGMLKPEIAFEVSLPARWNGRFYMTGNGGHAGESLADPSRTSLRSRALQMGFAYAQTNAGHDARKEPGASFVMSNPQKAIDYAYRAVHLTAMTAKAITATYYARSVAHSYWYSCSNGGREGLIEAQRYPQDFDGVVVNAPCVSQTGSTIGARWNQKALSAVTLAPAKLALLAVKVMAKCDAVDGLRDGLIDDPRRCEFDARRDVPACAAGADTDQCLTPSQADAVMKIYSGPHTRDGKSLFPGYMLGSEALVLPDSGNAPATSAWVNLIVPLRSGTPSVDFSLAEDTMRYLVFTPPRPTYDYRTFDFDRDVHLLGDWSRKVDATNTDLSRFRARGGKLLMTYGWADQVLQPLMGVNYYEAVVANDRVGTVDYFRLFMVPGMTHCGGGGGGTDHFDAVTAVIDWVEKGKAPDSLRATHLINGHETRSRPLCPYPQVARYRGRGSIDEASNFECVKP